MKIILEKDIEHYGVIIRKGTQLDVTRAFAEKLKSVKTIKTKKS